MLHEKTIITSDLEHDPRQKTEDMFTRNVMSVSFVMYLITFFLNCIFSTLGVDKKTSKLTVSTTSNLPSCKYCTLTLTVVLHSASSAVLIEQNYLINWGIIYRMNLRIY